MLSKKALAAALYPKYSRMVDEVNQNANVGKWFKENRSKCPVFDNKLELYEHINDELCGNCPIDYLEFGVYQGKSIRNWARINTSPQSQFIGFDSFEGLPETWNDENAAGTFSVNGQIPSIDDPRVRFVKGWFQKTLRQELSILEHKNRLLIHNDSDLYSSTIFVLTVLDFIIMPGSVIIFDEFSSPLHEFRAFHEYCNAYNREAKLVGMTSDFASQAAFVFL